MLYETILTIHIISFIWNISLVILADCIGLLWVLEKIERLPRKTMLVAHNLIWLGLIVSIISGTTISLQLSDYLLSTPAFYTKILFVLSLAINSVFISRHLNTALEKGKFANLTQKERRSFLISGAVSAVSWISVVVSAKMLGL